MYPGSKKIQAILYVIVIDALVQWETEAHAMMISLDNLCNCNLSPARIDLQNVVYVCNVFVDDGTVKELCGNIAWQTSLLQNDSTYVVFDQRLPWLIQLELSVLDCLVPGAAGAQAINFV